MKEGIVASIKYQTIAGRHVFTVSDSMTKGTMFVDESYSVALCEAMYFTGQFLKDKGEIEYLANLPRDG